MVLPAASYLVSLNPHTTLASLATRCKFEGTQLPPRHTMLKCRCGQCMGCLDSQEVLPAGTVDPPLVHEVPVDLQQLTNGLPV